MRGKNAKMSCLACSQFLLRESSVVRVEYNEDRGFCVSTEVDLISAEPNVEFRFIMHEDENTPRKSKDSTLDRIAALSTPKNDLGYNW